MGGLLKKDGVALRRAAVEAITEPKKPEKKHVLIKRKKTEEELAAEAKEVPSVTEESADGSVLHDALSAPISDSSGVGGSTAEVSSDVPLAAEDLLSSESAVTGASGFCR